MNSFKWGIFMYMNEAPEISKDFFCIVDRDKMDLAAVIYSYLATDGVYIPFFEYAGATIEKVAGDETNRDIHEMSRRRSDIFGVIVKNAFAQMNGTENIIMAGLSDEQKSYLSINYPDVNCIDVPDVETAEMALAAFGGAKPVLRCRPEHVLEGLVVALRENALLKMDATADEVTPPEDCIGGLVVIEAIPAVSAVIAVGYAHAIGANTRLVEPFEDKEAETVKYCMERWKGDAREALDSTPERALLQEMVMSRVGMVVFGRYPFCTFFTEGLPYSVILEDIIPFSYVHLLWKMDWFLFNAIRAESITLPFSAVVFSPQSFGEEEETTTAIAAMSGRNYFVKSLLGKDATAFNLDTHVKEYPYDLLHICSHGGGVKGSYCSVELDDAVGKRHTLEFDLVRSFHPGGPGRIIPVPTKLYWRKYNGKIWGSPEYKAAGSINEDLFIRFRLKSERSAFDGSLAGTDRTVPNSSCVRCVDYPFLGLFEVCAGGRFSPFVFNNACWSGYEMAEPFVDGGARGYIGTLWSVGNTVATQLGQDFYSDVFTSTILSALHRAKQKAVGTPFAHVYLFWGLHFSTIREGDDQ